MRQILLSHLQMRKLWPCPRGTDLFLVLMDRESGQEPGGVSAGESPLRVEAGTGGEVRSRTSEAEGVVPGQWVREACLVGVEVDSPHAWLVAATGWPRCDYWVAEAAVRQPAGIALVQAKAPGGIELAGGGQRGVVGFTELQGFLEGKLLRAGDEEHLPWGAEPGSRHK